MIPVIPLTGCLYSASTGATCSHGVLGPSVALANAASPHANNVLSLRLGQTTTQTVLEG